jgi:hypothetical protein
VAIARRKLDAMEAEADAGGAEADAAYIDRRDRLATELPRRLLRFELRLSTLNTGTDARPASTAPLPKSARRPAMSPAMIAATNSGWGRRTHALSRIGHDLSLAEDASAVRKAKLMGKNRGGPPRRQKKHEDTGTGGLDPRFPIIEKTYDVPPMKTGKSMRISSRKCAPPSCKSWRRREPMILRAVGITESQIEAMQRGRGRQGWNVHHKLAAPSLPCWPRSPEHCPESTAFPSAGDFDRGRLALFQMLYLRSRYLWIASCGAA